MDHERLIAPKHKRLAAFALDFILVFLLWYFMTAGDLEKVNTLMKTLDPESEGALDTFAQAVFQMGTVFLLKWVFCQTLYFCLVPAVIGQGKTLGKLLLRISLVDINTLEEMSPSRLVLREFVGRTVVETLLILPGIVSLFMTAFSADGKSLRDCMAHTVAVQDTSYVG